ncbi:MAG TPA: APC family permease [Solirubrobacteraceae bacterium]|nr:APC family permease [Solirubrobacteraceae bacterium]
MHASAPADLVTEATAQESAKLRRHFGRFDVLFFLICTIVGLDTIGSVATNGAQGFTWLLFLGIFFFAPYALLTAELGSAFPAEGGPYVWTRLAFGRFSAAVNSVIYWAANPIWLGGSLTITAVSVFGEFFTPLNGAVKWLFALVFIWIAVSSAILSLDKGKWLPTIGAFIRILLLGIFVLTVIVYAFDHGVHGFGVGDFSPTYGVFIAAVPVLFFNYVGFELPSAAGEELKNPQRDVPFTVVRSAVIAFLLYGGPVLAILLVLPTRAGDESRRLHRCDQDRVHRLWGSRGQGRHRHAHGNRKSAGRPRGDRLHPRSAHQRHHLDHGRRSRTGGCLL